MNHPSTLHVLVDTWVSPLTLGFFAIAYVLVLLEERLHLKKSIPVMVTAGLIWVTVAVGAHQHGVGSQVHDLFLGHLMAFAEIFCFLIAAMTFVNTMDDRGVFRWLGSGLLPANTSWKRLYWTSGTAAFILSPILDNLTTAMVVGTLVVTLAGREKLIVSASCISIVVAANAGGAFSPFGDLTTLMVWQAGHVDFATTLRLLLPSMVNWLVPAAILARAIPDGEIATPDTRPRLEPGAWLVTGCFGLAIALAVLGHQWLELPPVAGMMFGLGILKAATTVHGMVTRDGAPPDVDDPHDVFTRVSGTVDTFRQMERAEWDTLMFFYGIILAIGGLEAIGLLERASHALYGTLGPTWTHLAVGGISAVIDNVPVMAAVLHMAPDLSTGQWLLVTLTAGVGGSLLAVGSAAGVALLGVAHGAYTSRDHLRATAAIALGYAASIGTHLVLNRSLF
ncbi:MAG: sodium:proton antiporter NhaD [bacterium]|nr:sodium:proton antiporter NhaD [bacterium]